MQLQVETQIYKKDAIKSAITEAGSKANHYITLLNDKFGIRVHGKYNPDDPNAQPYSSFVQINSDDISMWRANQEKMRLDSGALKFYTYNGSNNESQHLLASYGDGLVLYKPGVGSGTDTPVVSINSSGANIDGSVTIGGKIQGDYLNSNIQVGGNNLLIGTAASVSKSTTATTSYVTQALYSTSDLKMLSELGFSVDDEITLSFDWKITSASIYGNARIEWYGKTASSDNTYIAPLISPFATFSASNISGHVEKTVKLTSATIQAKRLVLRIDNSNLTLTISNLKLEKGNKATSWSPAPEDLEKSYYGNCETAAATADKQVSCAGFNLKTGAIVGIKFTNGNTCESNITLNINGTGAKTVYFLGQTTGTDSRLNVSLAANAVVSVIYDGTYWRILSIDQTSTMVTRIGDDGISIHPSNTTQHRVEINSSGMNVYRNNTSIAEYGTSTRIGAISANTYRTEITSNGFKILQRNSGNTADTEISSFNSNGISFNANIPLTVGTTNSYIKWVKENNVWKIKIQADEITMGGHSVDTGGTWYTGTAITGTSTTATIFSNSGISYALVGDMYLNMSTNNTYRCTVEGNASTAKWVYVSNLKGNPGSNGTNGTNGTSYYVHIRYSANSDGTDFTASPQTNTQYIGIYSGTSSTAPTTKTSYTWSKYKGDKGDDTSSQYMTFTETNGLRVYSGNKTSNTYNTSYTQIKTDGITLVKGGHIAATFGSSITLNKPGTETAVVTIDSNGNATINNIKATSGTIGGFYIGGTELDAYGTASGAGTSSTGLYRVLMNANPGANGGNVALGVATRSSTSASWDWKAYINYNGTLVAKSANITGAITATSLTISGKDYASDITTISSKATPQNVKDAKEAAEKTATNYIGISGSGIKVAASSPTSASNYVEINSGAVNIVADSTHKTIINSTGMYIYAGDASNSVASFGTTATIGKDTEGKVVVTNSGIDMYGYDANASPKQQLLCHIGYGNCITNEGTAYGPYFSFGPGREWESGTNGLVSMAEGYSTKASGFCAHAEGFLSEASETGAHAEGSSNASADYAHAEGDSNASGKYSHAEGSSYATADYAHSEGYLSNAGGKGSHAEGYDTLASGDYSHTSGVNTYAGYEAQFAIGKYNHHDSDYIFMVGNGSSSKNSNAFAVTKSGTIIIGDHSSSVGSVLRATSSVTSLANDTATALCNLSIPAGTWILVGKCRFGGKAGNVRRLVICTSSADIAFATMAKTDGTGTGIQIAPGTSTAAIQEQLTHIVTVSSSTTFYFNAWHNAGSTLDIAIAELEAVRIC